MNIQLPLHDGTDPSFLVIDLFCGAGGVTTGFAMSGVAKVIACVNHDHTAILSHWSNHPEVAHFEEDMRALKLEPMKMLVNHCRALYPRAKVILHASLECTNYSKAKGGLAKEADSRTLADELHRYIDVINPDMVTIENVEEFADWGPLQIKPKRYYDTPEGWAACELTLIKNKHGDTVYGWIPIPERKGEDFKRWCNEIDAHGYRSDWKKMNAADFGAFTSRERLFGCFSNPESPLVFPEPTHSKTGKGGLQKWNAVKHKIDYTQKGYSIFNRKNNQTIPKRFRKEICDNTITRLLKGCIKQIAGGTKKYEEYKKLIGDVKVVNGAFILNKQNPAHLFEAGFLASYHGNGDNTHNLNNPAPVIPCNDNIAMINTEFIYRAFSNGGSNSSMEEPAGAIMRNPKLDLVQMEMALSMIDSTHYGNTPQNVDEPLGVITADRHWPYIFNPAFGGHTHSVDDPCPVIVARQDKAPLQLIVTEYGEGLIIYDTDSAAVIELKKFMALYGIKDIKMRMLTVKELLAIQGFPITYVLGGTQEEQKKHIGNSVEPNQMCRWALAMDEELLKMAA